MGLFFVFVFLGILMFANTIYTSNVYIRLYGFQSGTMQLQSESWYDRRALAYLIIRKCITTHARHSANRFNTEFSSDLIALQIQLTAIQTGTTLSAGIINMLEFTVTGTIQEVTGCVAVNITYIYIYNHHIGNPY